MDRQPALRELISFNETQQKELDADLHIGDTVDDLTKNKIIDIIKKYWDCFCKEGAKRTILGYQQIQAIPNQYVAGNRLTAHTRQRSL